MDLTKNDNEMRFLTREVENIKSKRQQNYIKSMGVFIALKYGDNWRQNFLNIIKQNRKNLHTKFDNSINYKKYLKPLNIQFQKDKSKYNIINSLCVYKRADIFQVLKIIYKAHKIHKADYKRTIKLLNYNKNLELSDVENKRFKKIPSRVKSYINAYYSSLKAGVEKNSMKSLKKQKYQFTLRVNYKGLSYGVKIKKAVFNKKPFLMSDMKSEFIQKIRIQSQIQKDKLIYPN